MKEYVEKRRQLLIEALLDPAIGFQQRGKAIDLLVPKANPLKDPSGEIDKALIRLLDPTLADKYTKFTKGKGCIALARRGQLTYF